MLNHKGMTAMEARRRGEKPGESKPASGMTRPHDQEEHGEDHNGSDNAKTGDGMHHHELHEHEDGSYSSKHTHPDGRVEEADHADYSDAKDHMDAMCGHGECDDSGDDGSMSHDSGGSDDAKEDLASLYDSD